MRLNHSKPANIRPMSVIADVIDKNESFDLN